MMKTAAVLTIALTLALASCTDTRRPVPRRPAYPRIEALPDSSVAVRSGGYIMDVNATATVNAPKDGWLDVAYPTYGATLHLTVSSGLDASGLRKAVDNRLERMSLNAGDIPARELEFSNAYGFQCRLLTAQSGRTPVQLLAVGPEVVVSGVVAFSGPTSPADSVAPVISILDSQMISLLKSLRRAD